MWGMGTWRRVFQAARLRVRPAAGDGREDAAGTGSRSKAEGELARQRRGESRAVTEDVHTTWLDPHNDIRHGVTLPGMPRSFAKHFKTHAVSSSAGSAFHTDCGLRVQEDTPLVLEPDLTITCAWCLVDQGWIDGLAAQLDVTEAVAA